MTASTEKAPAPTGKPPEEVTLEGMLMPVVSDEQPVLLAMPGTTSVYIPCFSDKEALKSVLARAGVPFEKIVTITDSREFLCSIPMMLPSGRAIHIALNPWFTPEGKVRFTQLLRE